VVDEMPEAGNTMITVPNFAVVAVLELVEILESHWLEEGTRTPADMSPEELEAQRFRAELLTDRVLQQKRTAATGSNVASHLYGLTDILVPTPLVLGALELIELLEDEAGRGE
jgi:hypothetical protein